MTQVASTGNWKYPLTTCRLSQLARGAFGTTTAITYAFAGLVNWLIAIEYIGGGIIGGIVGARLATHLGSKKKALSRLFAGVILVVAVYMLAVNLIALHL